MPIGKIRRATRYISRYREIIGVLVRYGLADWARRIDIDFAREILTNKADPNLLAHSTEERIRMALVELGPTYIKFGQTLSLRPDLIGVALSDELTQLQSNVPPDPFEKVEKTACEELKTALDEVFAEFDKEPVASASIGQVHRGRLKSGEKVAVKVRRTGIAEVVAADLAILKDLAELMENYIDESRYFRPKETVDRFSRTLTRELDFHREARNIMNIKERFADDRNVVIPLVYEKHTSEKLLVMEWIDGVSLNRIDEKSHLAVDRKEIAERGAEFFLKMILIDGFYHADPHPGNIMVIDGGKKIGLLDFGMVGRLSSRMREYIEDMVAAIITKDNHKLVRAVTKAGELPRDFDQTALAADITDYITYYGSMPVSKIKMFEALNELVEIIHRHHIVLPAEIVTLMRTLVTLEGTGRFLTADFNLFSLIEPYQKQMNATAFAAMRKITRARRFYEELSDFIETAPPAMSDIIERFRRGTLEIHMEHKRLEQSVNRLVFGVLTASMIIGSSMVLSASVPPLLFGLSLPGILGYIISLLMALRILWSLMVSDRLD